MSQNPRLTAPTNTDSFSSSQQNQTENYLYNLDKRVESYTYDNNGNRASATLTKNIPILITFYEDYSIFGIKQENQTTTASYTLDDNLIVYGDNTYLYDEDGYLQSKTTPQGTTTYSYGTLGELRQATTPTQTIIYKHNANNQRVAKLINGEITEKYLWANLTTLLAIYDNNDNLKQRFEYANQRMPVAMTTTDNTKYYLHYDQVGSLRAISDTNHNIIKEITYDTFGNILSNTNPNFKVPFGFAGGLYDSDTQLTRFGYRDYDAYVGKWTAKDPIEFGGGDSNLYGYVLGDPVGGVDPTGLMVGTIVKNLGKEIKECITNPSKCRTKTCNKLNALMHTVCDKKGLRCKGDETYVPLKLKKTRLQLCKRLRQAVNLCHGKKNDPKPGSHNQVNDETDGRIDNCNERIKTCEWY